MEADINKGINEGKNKGGNMNKNIQKKIRESQSQRLKDRQELLGKLQKICENVDKVEKKIQKNASLKTTLNKFETNLNARIDEIMDKMQIKLEKS